MLKLKECGCIVAILISLLAFNLSYSTEGPSLNINEYLNEIHSLQASFKQSIFSPANDGIDYTEGSVLLKKPGNIMWQFTVPSLKRIIVRNKKISTYDTNLNQVVIVPFSDRYQSSLANILLNNDSLMSYYQILSETTNKNAYSVILVQKKSNNLFTRIKITIVEMLLTEIKMWDASDQSIGISFDDVIINAPLADSSFEFSFPQGVDIFDQT